MINAIHPIAPSATPADTPPTLPLAQRLQSIALQIGDARPQAAHSAQRGSDKGPGVASLAQNKSDAPTPDVNDRPRIETADIKVNNNNMDSFRTQWMMDMLNQYGEQLEETEW